MKTTNTNVTLRPMGQLKSKVTVYCTICGCKHSRTLKVNIYENLPSKIEEAKMELQLKAKKTYTCRICKSITKSLKGNK